MPARHHADARRAATTTPHPPLPTLGKPDHGPRHRLRRKAPGPVQRQRITPTLPHDIPSTGPHDPRPIPEKPLGPIRPPRRPQRGDPTRPGPRIPRPEQRFEHLAVAARLRYGGQRGLRTQVLYDGVGVPGGGAGEFGGGEEALLDGEPVDVTTHGTVGVREEGSELFAGRPAQHLVEQFDGEGTPPPPPEEQNQRRERDAGFHVESRTEQLPRPLPHLPDPVGTPHDDQRQQRRVPDRLLERRLPNPAVAVAQVDRQPRLNEAGGRVRLTPQRLVQPKPREGIPEIDLRADDLVHL